MREYKELKRGRCILGGECVRGRCLHYWPDEDECVYRPFDMAKVAGAVRRADGHFYRPQLMAFNVCEECIGGDPWEEVVRPLMTEKPGDRLELMQIPLSHEFRCYYCGRKLKRGVQEIYKKTTASGQKFFFQKKSLKI